MEIEVVSISALSLDPANARKHPKKNLEAIKGSLKKFGQQKPIIVDGNDVVVAGNGTLAAARELGWKEIKVVRTKLTGNEAIAFALADNQVASLAEWDMEILGRELQALIESGFDIGEIGFGTKDFSWDDDQSEEKEKKPKKPKVVQCPDCGHEFTA